MNLRNQTLNNLYNYSSFLAFFQAWVQEEQILNPNLSIGKIAKNMELSHTASVSNILKGRRVPNQETVVKFKKLINLSQQEDLYLDLITEKDRNRDNLILTNALNLSINSLKNNFQVSVAN